MFILGYQYWEATSKFRGLSVCIEGMIYHMSQDFRGESVNFGVLLDSPEINTVRSHNASEWFYGVARSYSVVGLWHASSII